MRYALCLLVFTTCALSCMEERPLRLRSMGGARIRKVVNERALSWQTSDEIWRCCHLKTWAEMIQDDVIRLQAKIAAVRNILEQNVLAIDERVQIISLNSSTKSNLEFACELVQRALEQRKPDMTMFNELLSELQTTKDVLRNLELQLNYHIHRVNESENKKCCFCL